MDGGADLRVGAITDGDTPLHRAVKFHQNALVALIIDHTPEEERLELVNLCNTMGLQPLHYAAKYGFDDLAETLMHHGADPEIEDDAGRSAFAFAQAGGHDLCSAVRHVTPLHFLN